MVTAAATAMANALKMMKTTAETMVAAAPERQQGHQKRRRGR
jgi:hypothetical protein